MEEKKYNPGFAFYDTYYKAIENLPLEQQKEICYAYVKYGITYEMVDSAEMPLGYSFVMNNKKNIENSVDRWVTNQNKANFRADATISRDRRIAQLIAEGKKSKEIADIISQEYGKITDSTIRKTAPWQERTDSDFAVKWLGKNVNFSQSGTCECECEENAQFTENVKISQNFTGTERENSQLLGAAAQF